MDICVQISYILAMLSRTAEYALRAIIVLAASPSALTAQEVAARSKIPADYLAKILRLLVRAGLVSARRGRGGGFQISRPAEQTTVLDVVDAVDPLERIEVCPLGLAAHQKQLCPLHSKIDEAVRLARDAFAATTLASLSEEPPVFVEGENDAVA